MGYLAYPACVSFPNGIGWPTWQRAFRHGLLIIEPPHELASILNRLRERFDPFSAGSFGSHITVTPPFAAAPSPTDEERVREAVRHATSMTLHLGRPTQFSESSVVYLPVAPSEGLLELRAALLATGLFRLDLPHTTDFVPHLTLSEFGHSPEEALVAEVPAPEAMAFLVETVAWAVPDEAFRFTVRRHFEAVPGP